MAQPCERTGSKRGVFIETRSGIGSNAICTLGTRSDVKHIVTVHNLTLYPAYVECKGQIAASYKKVIFSSPNAGDSDIFWQASNQNLDDGDSYTFDHVTLLSNSSGIEKVSVEATIDWPQPSRQQHVRLSIDVSA
jgi:hypothetical protein